MSSGVNIVNDLKRGTGRDPRLDGQTGDGGTDKQKWLDEYIHENFDANGDGALEGEEEEAAGKFLEKYDKDGNERLNDEEIDIIQWDKDGDGDLNQNERGDHINFMMGEGGPTNGPALDKYDMYSYFGSQEKYEQASRESGGDGTSSIGRGEGEEGFSGGTVDYSDLKNMTPDEFIAMVKQYTNSDTFLGFDLEDLFAKYFT